MSPTTFVPGRPAVKSRPIRSGDGAAALSALVRLRRPVPAVAGDAVLPHDPLRPFAVAHLALTAQSGGDARDFVVPPGGDADHRDLGGQGSVHPSPRFTGPGSGDPRVVREPGGLHRLAQQRDRVIGLLRADEPAERAHRSLSVAKEAVAFFGISVVFACSAFSFRSHFSSSSQSSAARTAPGSVVLGGAGLLHPAPQGLRADAQLAGDRSHRPARRQHELDRFPLITRTNTDSCPCFPPGTASSGTSDPSPQGYRIKGKLQLVSVHVCWSSALRRRGERNKSTGPRDAVSLLVGQPAPRHGPGAGLEPAASAQILHDVRRDTPGRAR